MFDATNLLIMFVNDSQGGATSGFYVRNMISPKVEDTCQFLENLPIIDPVHNSS
jgi:hypothetical protein